MGGFGVNGGRCCAVTGCFSTQLGGVTPKRNLNTIELARMSDLQIVWLNTETAAKRLGITTRTLYRFINEGSLPAYRMGRVIRVNQDDVNDFIKLCRIEPGTLSHLYPDPVSTDDADKGEDGDADADS